MEGVFDQGVICDLELWGTLGGDYANSGAHAKFGWVPGAFFKIDNPKWDCYVMMIAE